jgi:hypothetical protein
MKRIPITLALLASAVAAQEHNYTPMPLPALEKFDASLIDTSKDATFRLRRSVGSEDAERLGHFRFDEAGK